MSHPLTPTPACLSLSLSLSGTCVRGAGRLPSPGLPACECTAPCREVCVGYRLGSEPRCCVSGVLSLAGSLVVSSVGQVSRVKMGRQSPGLWLPGVMASSSQGVGRSRWHSSAGRSGSGSGSLCGWGLTQVWTGVSHPLWLTALLRSLVFPVSLSPTPVPPGLPLVVGVGPDASPQCCDQHASAPGSRTWRSGARDAWATATAAGVGAAPLLAGVGRPGVRAAAADS